MLKRSLIISMLLFLSLIFSFNSFAQDENHSDSIMGESSNSLKKNEPNNENESDKEFSRWKRSLVLGYMEIEPELISNDKKTIYSGYSLFSGLSIQYNFDNGFLLGMGVEQHLYSFLNDGFQGISFKAGYSGRNFETFFRGVFFDNNRYDEFKDTEETDIYDSDPANSSNNLLKTVTINELNVISDIKWSIGLGLELKFNDRNMFFLGVDIYIFKNTFTKHYKQEETELDSFGNPLGPTTVTVDEYYKSDETVIIPVISFGFKFCVADDLFISPSIYYIIPGSGSGKNDLNKYDPELFKDYELVSNGGYGVNLIYEF